MPLCSSVAQQQRNFSAAEDQCFDAVARFHLVGNREESRACFGQEDVFQQFAEIFLVNVVLFFFVWRDELESVRENTFG